MLCAVERGFPAIYRIFAGLGTAARTSGIGAGFIKEPDNDKDLEHFRSSAQRGDPFVRLARLKT